MGTYHGTKDVKKYHYSLGPLLDDQKKREILEEAFERRVGYKLNFDNPQTFNEKIMWLKLYYQDPLVTKCCDKYTVKDYINEVVGDEYFVPTIAAWSDPDNIDFDALPDQFVLKVNWSSGYNIIVKDKSKLDIEATRKKLKRWMQPDRNSYYQYFSWGYKHMKPVVYAEKYLEQIDGQVYDYKFFFCSGKFEFLFISKDRSNDDTLTYDFFDNEFNHIDVTYNIGKHADPLPEKPKNYDRMLAVAEKLAQPFPFVRVDFYEVGDRIYVGEMTFYSGGGLLPFTPSEWDYKFGEKIKLPKKRIIDKEGVGLRLKKALKKTGQKLRRAGAKVKHFLAHKEKFEKNKYLCILGLRFPYETHIERTEKEDRKYIHILGIEFCYKKLPLNMSEDINTNVTFKYVENKPEMAYLMEGKLTPQTKRVHCEQKAYKQLGYFPNLKNPRSLNEKIIWLALNYKNPVIAVAADKGKAKEWVSQRVGSQYVVPLIGVYDDVNDIDFGAMPNRFVAKLNDGWGAEKVMIIRDKSVIDVDKVKAVLSSWLYPWNNYYYMNMCIIDEKMEAPAIVIEEYIEDTKSNVLDDYKFYCCNGEPKFALVVTGRGSKDQKRAFVDMDWNIMPFRRKGYKSETRVDRPQCLNEMKELARRLSADVPFVRVDFYEVDGRPFVGELTFTPGMFLKFEPQEWDFKLGEYLSLPQIDKE